MKSAPALFAAFFSALVLAVIATGFQAKQVKRVMPCVGECVPRAALLKSQKRSYHRLLGWRRMERARNRLRAAMHAQLQLGASGLERAFLCIHGFEGSWTDSGAPFWGGVQMDYGFQRTYGSRFLRAFGTADHWTPAMQLATAETAYLSGRGFYPWPNTARYCGLLP